MAVRHGGMITPPSVLAAYIGRITSIDTAASFSRQTFQLAAGLDIFLLEPAQIHFKCVAHRFFAAMGIEGLRLHVFNVDDFAIIIDKGNGQWQECVFHPHAHLGRVIEYKHHALIGFHLFAEHQTLFPLGFGAGYFGLDQVNANIELSGREARRLCLRHHGENEQADTGQ